MIRIWHCNCFIIYWHLEFVLRFKKFFFLDLKGNIYIYIFNSSVSEMEEKQILHCDTHLAHPLPSYLRDNNFPGFVLKVQKNVCWRRDGCLWCIVFFFFKWGHRYNILKLFTAIYLGLCTYTYFILFKFQQYIIYSCISKLDISLQTLDYCLTKRKGLFYCIIIIIFKGQQRRTSRPAYINLALWNFLLHLISSVWDISVFCGFL